ncbi:hypothetical protein L6452_24388 [Arctium lappa]|uniref:Uncharacterized protein n=1 Tax=Arctium lappa TaxID=4217 RepID=A0ACB9A8U3_ARCLA|nr:hypothetical protein L6452_24388 [Arctium lappa]
MDRMALESAGSVANAISSVWLAVAMVGVVDPELHAEIYEGYVPMVYSDYLNNMAKYFSVGEQGDHVTLPATADLVVTPRFQSKDLVKA